MFFYQGKIKDASEEYQAFLLDLDKDSAQPPLDNEVEVRLFKDNSDTVHIQIQQADGSYIDYANGVDKNYVDNKVQTAFDGIVDLIDQEALDREQADDDILTLIDELQAKKAPKFNVGPGLDLTDSRKKLDLKIDGTTIKTDVDGVLYADVTGAAYTGADPIKIDNNQVSLKYDSTLAINADGELTVTQAPGSYQGGQGIFVDTTANIIHAITDESTVIIDGNNQISLPINAKKIDTYLYSMDVEDIDWNYIKQNCDKQGFAGACTSIRYGNFHARNYDWYFNDDIEFIVRVEPGIGRFGSIGVARVSGVTEDYILNKQRFIFTAPGEPPVDWVKMLPGFTVDGINERGVCCNVNVTQIDDEHPVTNHTFAGKPSLYARNVVRYILDNATSAKDAVERLKNDVDIYSGQMGADGHNLHYMISDRKETYIVELVGDSIKVVECTKNKIGDIADSRIPYAVMSNFYLSDVDTVNKTTGELDIDKMAELSTGVERYYIGLEELKSFDDKETVEWQDVETLMHKKLWYTHTYTNDGEHDWHDDNCTWRSEYVDAGHNYFLKNAMTDPLPADVAADKALAASLLLSGGRNNRLWHTMHTSIYDLDSYSLIILSNDQYQIEHPIFHYELGETVYQNQMEDLRDFLKVGKVSKQPRSLVFNNTDSNIAGGSIIEKDCATAFGSGNKALGNSSFVMGQNNEARGDAATVMGKGNIATGDYQVVIGKYNELDTEDRYVFIVGGGAYNNRKNIFAIDKDGNVHIPTGSKFVSDL